MARKKTSFVVGTLGNNKAGIPVNASHVDVIRDSAHLGRPTTVRLAQVELDSVAELARRLNATRSVVMRSALRHGLQELSKAAEGIG